MRRKGQATVEYILVTSLIAVELILVAWVRYGTTPMDAFENAVRERLDATARRMALPYP